MQVEVPAEALETKKWQCQVRSNHNVATFIKEFVLEFPPGKKSLSRRAAISKSKRLRHEVAYKDFEIDGVSSRLGQVQCLAIRFEGRRAGGPGLFDGQLSGRKGHHYAQCSDRQPSPQGS